MPAPPLVRLRPPAVAEPMLDLPLHRNLPTGLFLLPMNALPPPGRNWGAGGLPVSHNFCFRPLAGVLVVCTTQFLRLSRQRKVWLGRRTPSTRLAVPSPPRSRGEPRGSADDRRLPGPPLADGPCPPRCPLPFCLPFFHPAAWDVEGASFDHGHDGRTLKEIRAVSWEERHTGRSPVSLFGIMSLMTETAASIL